MTADNAEGVEQKVFDGMADRLRDDRAHFLGSFFKDFFGVGTFSHPVSDEVLEWARTVAMSAGIRPTLKCAEAFATTDFRGDLQAFDIPTLIIHGAADATVPIKASARPAAQGIAGAELIEYEDHPHGLFATHKHQLARDLIAFLKR
jgi:pimeloyl-ACP methyl ester carboxylesterase